MEEKLIKTHLIVVDVHDEYNMRWCGKIAEADPWFENDMPIFVVVGRNGRVELNTVDIKRVEECAKRMTQPRGREAITKDTACVYIKEKDKSERVLGVLEHRHIKRYAPMYDKVGYR